MRKSCIASDTVNCIDTVNENMSIDTVIENMSIDTVNENMSIDTVNENMSIDTVNSHSRVRHLALCCSPRRGGSPGQECEDGACRESMRLPVGEETVNSGDASEQSTQVMHPRALPTRTQRRDCYWQRLVGSRQVAR